VVLAAGRRVVFVLAGAAGELFGGDLDTGDRSAQLVGGVDQEAAGSRLGALVILRSTVLGGDLQHIRRFDDADPTSSIGAGCRACSPRNHRASRVL